MNTPLTKTMMQFPLVILLASSPAPANDSFNSELSHFAGNAVIASATTIVVDKYYPKIQKPAKTGFIVSASEAVLGEAAERMTGGKFSLLDAAVGTVGAAAGAYLTDKWYVAPRMETRKGETTYGVMATHRF